MGHSQSKEKEHFRKLIVEKGLLKLPLGSEVERLFHEDFDADAREKSLNSASRTPITPSPAARGFGGVKESPRDDGRSQDKWAPVDPDRKERSRTREGGDERLKAHRVMERRASARSLRPEDAAEAKQRIGSDPGHQSTSPSSARSTGTAPTDIPLGLSKTKSSTAVDPAGFQLQSQSLPVTTNNTDNSHYDPANATSRWQARISRRISDRQANDEEKLRLSIHNPDYEISEEDRIRLSQITTAYSAVTAVGDWEERVRFSGSTMNADPDGSKEGKEKEGVVVRRISSIGSLEKQYLGSG